MLATDVKPIQSQLNAWREARKQRLLAKLLRANPKANVAALENLVGFTSSAAPAAPKKSCMQNLGKENSQPLVKRPNDKQVHFESKDSKPAPARPVGISNTKQPAVSTKPSKVQNEASRGTFFIKPTTTSLRRETMATEGIKIARPEPSGTKIKRSVSFREPPLRVKTPTRKLTIPITPEFAKPRERISRARIAAPNPAKQPLLQKQASRTSNATDHFSRRSVSVASRKSVFYEFEPQQPEKEKVRQWLDKRGRSTSSCRHVSCMGYSLQEIEQVPSSMPAVKRPTPQLRASSAVSTLKAKAAIAKEPPSSLNETFEKESEDQQPQVNAEPKPAASDEVFPSPLPETATNEETPEAFITPDKQEEKTQEITFGNADGTAGIINEEKDLVTQLEQLDMNPSTDKEPAAISNIEQLLRTILLLLDQPQYPEEKILHWMRQASTSFPGAANHALFWEIRARLAQLRGDIDKALSIYKEALGSGAEPLTQIEQLFEDFLKRIPDSLPAGQRTPVANSLGVSNKPQGSSRTPRRPLLDASQIFQSSAIKYELKIMRLLKIADSSEVDKPKLVATPVRRSTRPKSVLGTAERNKVFYLDDLEELSPTTKENVEVRQNSALFYI